MNKKIILVILDGLPDDPIKELDNKTPVEISNSIGLHEMAKYGQGILVKTLYNFLPLGSITALLGILGYIPYDYYPHGRASFEVEAQNILLNENDLVFRCNTVQLDKKKNKIVDFQAGMIDTSRASKIIDYCKKLLPNGFELIAGKSYRHSLIVRKSLLEARDIMCFEPHTHIGQPISSLFINNANVQLTKEKREIINRLNKFMNNTIQLLGSYNIKENTKADMLWLWSPSYKPKLPQFKSIYGFNSAKIITGSDFLTGISKIAGIDTENREDFTGDSDTNLEGKKELLFKYINSGDDFVLLHINATDEESHRKNYIAKKNIIEKIDKIIINPLYNKINKSKNRYVLAVGGDHYTSCVTGNHKDNPVPMLIYDNKKIMRSKMEKFSEEELISNSKIQINSYELINKLIGI
jgi:2,3-bisphosphoglycerate-independent phosphoglycerate mutase